MPGQEILRHLQNMVDCLEFLMGYPRFQHNQIYKLPCVFNKSENQVYNEIYIGK